VGQDPLTGPDPCPVQVVEAGAVPAVLPFESADPGFAAGAPLDDAAERPAVLVGLPGVAGTTFAVPLVGGRLGGGSG
jgi:hypothetical protein